MCTCASDDVYAVVGLLIWTITHYEVYVMYINGLFNWDDEMCPAYQDVLSRLRHSTVTFYYCTMYGHMWLQSYCSAESHD